MQNVGRKKTRKLLFQKLYSNCFSSKNDDLFMEFFYSGVFNFEVDKHYLCSMEKIIFSKEKYLIEIIRKLAPKFDIKNMSLTYIVPMYISLAEIFYLEEEIPIKVSINESIEIAKIFGDDSSKKIVNGVLNKVLENYDTIKKETIQKNISNNSQTIFFGLTNINI